MKKSHEDFVKFNKDPFHWAHSASMLIRSADVLSNAEALDTHPTDRDYNDREGVANMHSCSRSHSLLMGYALENCLKGLAVKKNPDVVVVKVLNENNGSKGFKYSFNEKHNLLELAKSVDFELNESERHIIEWTEDFIQWRGRYPSPKNTEGKHAVHFGGIQPQSLRPIIMRAYNELIKNIEVLEENQQLYEVFLHQNI